MKTIRCRKCNRPTLEHQFEERVDGSLVKLCPLCRLDEITQKKKNRRKQVYRKHELTEAEYQEMYEAQNYRCLICSEESPNKALAVDHNHETGEVRGLLCARCNTGLGLFRDNPQLLKRAVAYLFKYGSYG